MTSDANRRDYFRINDKVILKFHLIDGEPNTARPAEQFFADESGIALLRELRDIDAEHNKLLRAIAEQNRDIELYLKGINKKIDLIANALIDQDQPQSEKQGTKVSLSEGGLAFRQRKAMKLGQFMAMYIGLLPSNTCIITYAEIVEVEELNDGTYRISTEFVDIPAADQQILARHILQVQIAQKKSQENREKSA